MKIKDRLTPGQSQRLIELGVAPSKASGFEYLDPYGLDDAIPTGVPLFTLSDILSLLPKELCNRINGIRYDCHLSMYGYNKTWGAMYRLDDGDDFLVVFESPELIDALYKLLVWSITNQHLKL
jgi:hypothetical protein